MDIVSYIMYWNLLAADSTATDVQYVRVNKTLAKLKCVLLFHGNLGKDASVENNFGSRHLYDPKVYIYSQNDLLLMIQTAHEFVEINRKIVLFYDHLLNRHATDLRNELLLHNLLQYKEKLPDTKIQQAKWITLSIISLSISNLRPFEYNTKNKAKNLKKRLVCGRSVYCWRHSDLSVQRNDISTIDVFRAKNPWKKPQEKG